jgi:hypothetical protein
MSRSYPNHAAEQAVGFQHAPVIPVAQILPWAILIGLMAILAIYFVGAEQGATSVFRGMYIHEFVHDGRHLLGFPCH